MNATLARGRCGGPSLDLVATVAVALRTRDRIFGGQGSLRDVRRRRWALEDDADHDLAVAIDLIEDAAAYPLGVEKAADGGFELNDEEVHADDL